MRSERGSIFGRKCKTQLNANEITGREGLQTARDKGGFPFGQVGDYCLGKGARTSWIKRTQPQTESKHGLKYVQYGGDDSNVCSARTTTLLSLERFGGPFFQYFYGGGKNVCGVLIWLWSPVG